MLSVPSVARFAPVLQWPYQFAQAADLQGFRISESASEAHFLQRARQKCGEFGAKKAAARFGAAASL